MNFFHKCKAKKKHIAAQERINIKIILLFNYRHKLYILKSEKNYLYSVLDVLMLCIFYLNA